MIIDVEYDLDIGGTAYVTKDEEAFEFEIIFFDENDYAEVGIEIDGHGKSMIINDVYKRNALPSPEDVSSEEYNKIYSDLDSRIVGSIKSEIESSFEND